METTIKNLLLIKGSELKNHYDGNLSSVVIFSENDFEIEYMYNVKFNEWSAFINKTNLNDCTKKIKINAFNTINQVLNQIYFITGKTVRIV